MTTIQQRLFAATSLILVSTACLATEPDQLALELALSLSAQAPASVQKSTVDPRALAQAAVAAEVALLTGGAQQQGEK